MAKRAAKTTLPDDSIVADVVTQLDNPIEYVRRVLVRIGVRGRVECPNYLIEYILEDKKSHEKSVFADAAYSGSTHRELAPRHIEETRSWSREEMNVTAISALIGRLRKPSAPRPYED